MTQVLTEIITMLTSGISQMAQGIGAGIGDLVTEIFLAPGTDGGYTLSTFGGIVVVFAGISLAIGLSKLVVHWVSGLGGSKAM